jgi:hypothetical protein
MAESCDVVFSCLPDFGAIDFVALGPDGVLGGARAGAAFAMSTNTPDLVRRPHAAFLLARPLFRASGAPTALVRPASGCSWSSTIPLRRTRGGRLLCAGPSFATGASADPRLYLVPIGCRGPDCSAFDTLLRVPVSTGMPAVGAT